jgi:hypothetical protein
MCNVPSGGMMALFASRGADSTDMIEVQVSAEGFARRDLYLGPARTVVTAQPTQRTDTLALPPRRVRMGDAQLTGTVVAVAGGRPLAGAQVSITDGPQTRANERGEWTLLNAPIGTRMLEVRALGYYPDRRPVNVVAGAAPVRVALSTLKAVLDTVRVSAARLRYDRDRNAFQQRRRSGLGRYLTAEDIARRHPIVTSDLFRILPGLRVDRSPLGETLLTMRGTFEETCFPAFYLDGHHMRYLSADDIDDFVKPDEVAGIEVYTGAAAPPQFQQGLSGCGSIVIWTK